MNAFLTQLSLVLKQSAVCIEIESKTLGMKYSPYFISFI